MRRGFVAGVLLALVTGAVCSGSAVVPFTTPDLALKGREQRNILVKVQGDQVTSVIVSGEKGATAPLTLYVFDPQGNCVAWDDRISASPNTDELFVEWFAPAAGVYSLNLNNVSNVATTAELIVR